MRVLVLSSVLGLVACGGGHQSDTPAQTEAWTISDYRGAGIPAPDHTWSADEVATAAKVVIAAASRDPLRLPRLRGSRSGTVFAHLVEPGVDDTLPAVDWLAATTKRDDALFDLMGTYASAPGEHFHEVAELMGAHLRGLASSELLYEPLLWADTPEDRPAARAAADKLRSGYAEKFAGVLTMIQNERLPIDARRRLLWYTTHAAPALFPRVTAADRAALTAQITRTLADRRFANLHDDLAALEHALSDEPHRPDLSGKLDGSASATGHHFPEAAISVARTGSTLTFTSAAGRTCGLGLADVLYVKIHTTDEGPRYPDMFWEIGTSSTSCVVDSGAIAFDLMFNATRELKGFSVENYKVIAQASGSSDNRTFVVWTRQGS